MRDCKMCRTDYLAREPGTCLVCGAQLDDPMGLRWTCDLMHARHLFHHDSRWRDPAFTLAQLAGADAGPSIPRPRNGLRHVGRHRRHAV